jgi:PAS domain S-box-containing protein
MRTGEQRESAPSRADVPLRNRMWVRLVLAMAALLMLAIVITAGQVVRLFTQELRRTLTQRNEQIARRAAAEIRSYIDMGRRDLAEMSDVLQFLERTPWVSAVLLENHVMASGMFETVFLMDRGGRVLADNRLGAIDLAEYPPTAIESAMQGRAWTSPLQIDTQGLPSLVFVSVLSTSISIVARLPLERTWRLIDDIEAGPGGFAYVTAADGLLVAHPDKTRVARGERIEASESATGVLRVQSPIPELGWIVSIQQPLGEAFFPIASMVRRSVAVMLGGFAVAILLGAIFARLFSRSMDGLLLGTRKVAAGDLAYRIPAGPDDEFGVLSRSFNSMADRLRERTLALEDSERRHRHVTESVADIIYSIDARGRFTFLNSRVQQILGYAPSEMIGRPVVEFAASDMQERQAGEIATMFREGRPSLKTGELRARARWGEELTMEYESTLSVAPSGETEIYGVIRDVTVRRRMEERLRRSERLAAIGEIVSRVAHELRNAVSGIAASMELAGARRGGDGSLPRELAAVLSEARRAQSVVQGLLGSSSDPAAEPRPCSLNDALSDALRLRHFALKAAAVTVFLELAKDAPAVMADPDRLRQVFLNLLDNAEHALSAKSDGRRVITISSGAGGGRVWAEVCDTGPGIPPELIGRIFDPFFTTRRERGGTGLGLAVSLGIVEACGGDLRVRSVVGHGATFTVDLPAAGARGALAPADLSGTRILVAEDESSIREFVAHFLESLGCEVDAARNGAEAVALLADGTAYSLVISDFRMPDRDGKQLYEWIRGSRPALLARLIYITGDSLNPETRAFLGQTQVPYLLKPVVASALEAEVRRALAALDRDPGDRDPG